MHANARKYADFTLGKVAKIDDDDDDGEGKTSFPKFNSFFRKLKPFPSSSNFQLPRCMEIGIWPQTASVNPLQIVRLLSDYLRRSKLTQQSAVLTGEKASREKKLGSHFSCEFSLSLDSSRVASESIHLAGREKKGNGNARQTSTPEFTYFELNFAR